MKTGILLLMSMMTLGLHAKIIYVDNTDVVYTYGSTDGSTWTKAFPFLEIGINAASAGDTIWVAEGRYVSLCNSFTMKEGVKIYGGFSGIETMQSERDWVEHETILDGKGENSVIINDDNGLTSAAVLDGFTITNGNAQYGGGGIYNDGSSPILTNLTISGNTTSIFGGGIYNDESSPIITNVTISGNTTSVLGGGISNVNSSSPILTNVTISGNRNTKDDFGIGGGIYNYRSSPILTNVTISGNTASDKGVGGGGIFNDDSSPILTNVTISGNTAPKDGGGIFNTYSSPTLTNVTISGNTASRGGGIYNHYSTPILYNTIVLDDLTGMGSSISSESSNNLRTGNPTDIFVDAANDDFNLKAGSPAINTGSNSFVTVTTDIAGNDRIILRTVDIGAYEYVTSDLTRYYVDVDAEGLNDGTSWEDAFTDFGYGLHLADAGDTIWVADGNYVTSGSAFTMKEGVKTYGGFSGVERMQSERDWEEHETILDGNGANSVIRNDRNGLTNAAVLDGFTITNGDAESGGGIYNDDSSPTLTNVTISGNTASDKGGGIYNVNSSSPIITNVIISENIATEFGGGIYNDQSSPTLTNVTISGNTAENNDAGGIYNDSSHPIITNVTISGNTAAFGTDGIYNSGSTPIFYNTIVLGGIYGDPISSGSSNNLTTGNPTDIFVDAANDDFNLKAGSPAIDRGDNSKVPSGVTTDIAGNDRIGGGTVDLGAYEYHGCSSSSALASTEGTHVGTSMYEEGSWTYYCNGNGELLLGLALDPGLTTSPSDVTIKIESGATYVANGVGFINNVEGVAIMNRRWNVDVQGTSAGNSGVRLFNRPGDLDSLNAALDAVNKPQATSTDEFEYFKIASGISYDVAISALTAGDVELIEEGTTAGLNTYVMDSLAGLHSYVEYEVSSFSGGGFGVGAGGTVLPLSAAASLSFYAENSASFRVYPTVTSGDLTIEFNKPIEESIDVHIYNTLGGLVQVQTISINTTEETIPVGNLSSGMYWIQVDGYTTSTPSFVVQ